MHPLTIPIVLLALTIGATAIVAYRAIPGIISSITSPLVAIQATIAAFEWPTSTGEGLTDDPRTAELVRQMQELTIAVDTGVNRVQRSENRVRAIVQGARKELASHGFEHAGLEAEASQLHDVDGGGGDAEPVPAVPENVEAFDDTPSSIPGISVGTLRRARSLRG